MSSKPLARPGPTLLFLVALSPALLVPAPGGADDGYEAVVRAPRGEAAGDPTASATVIDASRYEGEAKTVAELVATAPGVAVSEYGGLGHAATVSLRGATADGVKVLLDGLQLNTGGGGGVDLASIPRPWISRIEIVRGAEGAHYGSGALGGVVNVITRPAAAGRWSAQAGAGSFGTFSAAADAATGSDDWAALAAVSAEASDARFPYLFDATPALGGDAPERRLRDHNAYRLGGGLLKLRTRAGRGHLDALAELSGGHREIPGFPYAPTRDWQRDGRGAGTLRYEAPLADGWTAVAEVVGRHDRLDAVTPATRGDAVRQRGLAGATRASLTWARGPSTLTAGLSAGAERFEAPGLGPTRERPELALSLAEDLALLGGRLRLAPAVRAERIGPFDGWSGKLGASLRVAGPFTVRASAGHTFRAPSFTELHLEQGFLQPNPELRPEEGSSADVSLAADGRLGVVSAAAFASLYRDLILYDASGLQRLKPFNSGKALVSGLEVEVASAPLRRLLGASGAAAYTLLASKSLRGAPEVVGNELPHRARHRLYARAAVGQGPAGLHLELHRVGRQWQDARNVLAIPAATAVHAGGWVRVWRRPDLRLHLEAKNLLDRRTLQDRFGNPLPGRTVLFTVRGSSSTTRG